ncbi:MAG: phosphoribosylglycinamide formyltransferase [Rhodospirillaceae bacterium]|jgi:phosphoribosylglycinamide formyltransferase 1|nr:phosphoribosylglycinamide formyltransferase [Rhodospirillaceae bacterium]MBT4425939.1 phosphoribosylglycinamide formyltransferase [Rhodospirillaceae bacterium]MBT5039347.1 phosphoribosylglycinamide formyltransferase [Rhodospirillaceae bacterium]MBT5674457.1 phosphoribosylglycinamide formyltransferase [Rhodospirillaceae bacterium]
MSKRENDSKRGRNGRAAQLKLAVLISGSGTNLQALIDACAEPDYPARISLVIANKDDAGGLARAAKVNIATQIIRHKDFAEREAFDQALSDALEAADIDLICLAGFMRVLGATFVEHWKDRLINIHPALLPSFKGLHTHQRALEAGVRIAGCTVHYVRADVDVGPIIAQAAVPVLPGDNEDNLAARVLKQEHRLYPLAVELIARGLVHVENGRVRIEEADSRAEDAALINPPPFG